MLRKKESFTVVTPIPGFIPRQFALDILHAHSEVITLNPLVLSHRPVPAPRHAAADEYYSTWYEIEEQIKFLPGLGRAGSGRISFLGCFHDMPWGFQMHIYAPMNIDLRNRYRVAGNQPGVEPPEPREIGLEALGAPYDGLYLCEDIEIKCNIAMVGFVRTQLRAASREMVQRIIKKAELLDAGVLHAMMDNGRLRTINPNDRSSMSTSPIHGSRVAVSPGGSDATSESAVNYRVTDPYPSPLQKFRQVDAVPKPYRSNSNYVGARVEPSSFGAQEERAFLAELPGDGIHSTSSSMPHPRT